MKKMLLMFLTIVLLAATTYAGDRKIISQPDDFGPYYADWYWDDDWVVWIFYRDPSCIPDGSDPNIPAFNLLEFFYGPAVFCPELTVKGFEIRKNSEDLVPIQGKYHGLGDVPVWFIWYEDYLSATADGYLSIDELESLPSLIKGSAIFYQETLHPSAWGQGHFVPMKNIVAKGILYNSEEYEIFWFNVVWFLDQRNINVNIVLK